MTDAAPVPSSSTQEVVVTAPKGQVPDDVTLTVNGQVIEGWTEVRITRRAEGIPNDFEVGLTSTNPDGSQVVARAGQSVVVKIGRSTVITGSESSGAGSARIWWTARPSTRAARSAGRTHWRSLLRSLTPTGLTVLSPPG